MANPRFKYQTSFIPVSYEREQRGMWIFKQEALPIAPDPASLYAIRSTRSTWMKWGLQAGNLCRCNRCCEGSISSKRTTRAALGWATR